MQQFKMHLKPSMLKYNLQLIDVNFFDHTLNLEKTQNVGFINCDTVHTDKGAMRAFNGSTRGGLTASPAAQDVWANAFGSTTVSSTKPEDVWASGKSWDSHPGHFLHTFVIRLLCRFYSGM